MLKIHMKYYTHSRCLTKNFNKHSSIFFLKFLTFIKDYGKNLRIFRKKNEFIYLFLFKNFQCIRAVTRPCLSPGSPS